MIAALGDLDRAERHQVIGDILGVEQPVSAGAQARHQMHQRDLRCVAGAMEHALAEEGAAERNAIETADQRIAVIDFDAVGMPVVVEAAVDLADAAVDPGFGAVLLGFGAALDRAVEIPVDPDGIGRRAHGARQPRGDVKAIERNDAAHLRLDPIERRILGALCHREDAAGIGLEQHFRRDLDNGAFAVGHQESQNPRRILAACAPSGEGEINHSVTMTRRNWLKFENKWRLAR